MLYPAHALRTFRREAFRLPSYLYNGTPFLICQVETKSFLNWLKGAKYELIYFNIKHYLLFRYQKH
jgi:hypothetical protein